MPPATHRPRVLRRATHARTRPRTLPAPDTTAAPSTRQAMHAVMCAMPLIPKTGYNKASDYYFQQLDDVIDTLRKLCKRHGLLIVPDARITQQGPGTGSTHAMWRVTVSICFTIYGPSGDPITATFPGEAVDEYDKATNKATSGAWKACMRQLFLIRTEEQDDPDNFSPGAPHRTPKQTPPPATAAANVTPVNVQAFAARVAAAAQAKTADEIVTLYKAAKEADASETELKTLQLLGERKRKGEEKAAQRAQQTPRRGEPTGQHEKPTNEQNGDAHQHPTGDVPPQSDAVPDQSAPDPEPGEPTVTDVNNTQQDPAPTVWPTATTPPPPTQPQRTPQDSPHAIALAFLFEGCSESGLDPDKLTADFEEQHGHSLQDATAQQIEAFATSLWTPSDEIGSENGSTEPA